MQIPMAGAGAEDLVKMQILIPQIWTGTQESVFLQKRKTKNLPGDATIARPWLML